MTRGLRPEQAHPPELRELALVRVEHEIARIAERRVENRALVIVTHDPKVRAIADRVVSISDGNFVYEGPMNNGVADSFGKTAVLVNEVHWAATGYNPVTTVGDYCTKSRGHVWKGSGIKVQFSTNLVGVFLLPLAIIIAIIIISPNLLIINEVSNEFAKILYCVV